MDRPSFRVARTLMNAINEFDELLFGISESGEDQAELVKTYQDKIIREQVMESLKDTPVDVLADAKKGIRVSVLKENRITNLGQICSMSMAQLEKISGIGPKTAQAIHDVVVQLAYNRIEEEKLRIDMDHKVGLMDSLVQSLYRLRMDRKVARQAEKLYKQSHDRIAKLTEEAKPARSWFRWTMASPEKREQAIASLQELQEMMDGEYAKSAKAIVSTQEKALKAKHDEYWGDYEQNAAAYYSTLENVKSGISEKSGLGSNQTIAVRNGLPEELAVAIAEVPLDLSGFECELRPYQRYGVQYILKQGAVLLGDEMGLGKTVEAIGAMVSLRNIGGTHFLVVCPASVLVNWIREIEKFSDLMTYKVHGKEGEELFDKWTEEGGVAVTTYEKLNKLVVPNDFTYDMMVVDEAHYAKNPEADRTMNVLYFRQRTDRVLYMTGTPIENNVEEMCFLIGCLQPEVAKEVAGSTSLSRAKDFRKKISGVYFRRSREDVLTELPEKVENEEWVELTSEETKLYRSYVYTESFTDMRQVSWKVQNPALSSKGERLKEIVEEYLEAGRKIIIFSFFLNTIEQVQKMLDVPMFGPISGAIAPAKRQAVIDEFSACEGGAVLLSQIQAGGTGLNIQAASVIIFTEPQLKPSIENQAIARAYRMGQVNTVMVHRLLCDNTVDERILEMLREKQEVFDSFADISESGQESLSSNEMMKAILEAEKNRMAEGNSEIVEPEEKDSEETPEETSVADPETDDDGV